MEATTSGCLNSLINLAYAQADSKACATALTEIGWSTTTTVVALTLATLYGTNDVRIDRLVESYLKHQRHTTIDAAYNEALRAVAAIDHTARVVHTAS